MSENFLLALTLMGEEGTAFSTIKRRKARTARLPLLLGSDSFEEFSKKMNDFLGGDDIDWGSDTDDGRSYAYPNVSFKSPFTSLAQPQRIRPRGS